MASAPQHIAARGSLSDLARLTDRSRQAISKLAQRKVFEVASDGTVDLELARLAIANRVRQRMRRDRADRPAASPLPPAPPAAVFAREIDGPLGYEQARALREAAEARLAELKLAEQRGELVRVAEVEASLAAKVSALREGFLQMPARLAPILAAESDQARCHDILQAELRQVLAQLTEGNNQ